MNSQKPARPLSLTLIRHGQSAGNVARDAAEAAGLAVIDIGLRDMDVPLSSLGEEQARALGHWLAGEEKTLAIDRLFVSPYMRAVQTGQLVASQLTRAPAPLRDERVREREFGIVDRLTKRGIKERFPDQAELHARLKKFYYRPPGGESWCDVLLRLRSFLDSLDRECAGQHVVVVCHSVVILCFRYLLENLSEEEILAIDREKELANCALTTYEWEGERYVLKRFNFVAPLEAEGTTVTRQKDATVRLK